MPGASQIAIVILHGRLLFGPKPNKEIRFWYQVWFQAYMYAKARACSITVSSVRIYINWQPKSHEVLLRKPLYWEWKWSVLVVWPQYSLPLPGPHLPKDHLCLLSCIREAGRNFIEMKTIKTPQSGTVSPLRGLK